MKTVLRLVLCLFLAGFVCNSPATAQDGPTTDDIQNLIDQIKAQTELIKAQAELAKAQRDATLAKFPTGDTKGQAGTVSAADGVPSAANVLVHETLRIAIHEAAAEVAKKADKRPVLLVSDLDLVGIDLSHKQIKATIEDAISRLCTQIQTNNEAIGQEVEQLFEFLSEHPDAERGRAGVDFFQESALAPSVALPAISGTLSALGDIAKFFKVDYTVKSTNTTLNDSALHAVFLGALAERCIPIYQPKVRRIDESLLLSNYQKMLKKRLELQVSRDRLKVYAAVFNVWIEEANGILANVRTEMKDIQGKLNAATRPANADALEARRKDLEVREKALSDNIGKARGLKKPIDNAISSSGTLLASIDSMLAAITDKGEDDKYSPLGYAVISELLSCFDGEPPLLLQLAIESKAAETITAQSTFGSGQLNFLAGVSMSYMLVDQEGKVLVSDTSVAMMDMPTKLKARRVRPAAPRQLIPPQPYSRAQSDASPRHKGKPK